MIGDRRRVPSRPASIETARLLLRRPTSDDVAVIFAYASDVEVTRWLAWPRHRTPDDARAFVEFADAAWARDGVGPLLIVERASGEVIGSTGLDLRGGGLATTGYVLTRAAWGRGYASEALAGIVELARAHGLARLSACVHPDNLASIRVLEKGGFVQVSACACHAFPNLALDGPIAVLEYARDV